MSRKAYMAPMKLNTEERRRLSVKTGLWIRRFVGRSPNDSDSLKNEKFNEDYCGPLGLNLLHEPDEPLIDLVFVHGLGGGSRKTWSKTAKLGHYWPKEWLPTEPNFKNVRIHSFGYNANWRERAPSVLTLHDFAQALLGDIYNSPKLGQNAKQTPIILVGHSMGGLVIKKMFLLAKYDPHYKHVVTRIHSLFFLATPHRGADMAKLLKKLLTLVSLGDGSKPYVESLSPQSDALQAINDQFRHSYQGVKLWSFFETQPTILGMVVEKWSAVLELPGEQISHLNADHSHVCKFDDPADSNYCRLRDAFVTAIRSIDVADSSPSTEDFEERMEKLSQYLGLAESPAADYMNKIEHRTEGSCSWLTDKDTFVHWLNGQNSSRVFWLSGEPASGKSTIAAHVIQLLGERNKYCAYFFFKDSNTGSSRTANLLCSLAYQMAANNQEICEKLFDMCERGITIDLKDERALWRALFATRILRVQPRQTQYWVIDALEECENYSAIISFLAKVTDSFSLRVFFTSRPSLAIERVISCENIQKISESITPDDSLGDIRLFVQAHSPYFLTQNDLERQDLVKNIVTKSNGNFLWTYLVVRKIMDAVSVEQVHDILVSIPDGIGQLYSHILEKVMSAPETEMIARGILRWTLCALRPLHVDELQEVLRLDIGKTLYQLEKTVGEVSGNLIVVDANRRAMATHQTVREYIFQDEVKGRFFMAKASEHARIVDVCLSYLSSDTFKISRFRRDRSSNFHKVKRSPFAAYAAAHFSDHLVRAPSANPAHLAGLDKFLTTNPLTWIEMLATPQGLTHLVQAAQNMNLYLERRAKYESPGGSEVQNVAAWANDITHLIAQFGTPLVTCPQAIFYLIPAVCPRDSIISKSSKASHRRLQAMGLSQTQWDDRLCCIVIPGARILSVSCNDSRLALGVSTGKLYIYREATFQEELQLDHGEHVLRLSFASAEDLLVSAGRKKVSCWNVTTGMKLWHVSIKDEAVALSFGQDDTVLYVATKGNYALILDSGTGGLVDSFQFCDWDEEERCPHRYRRPPIYADFSPALGLLGLSYLHRPVNFWDLERHEYGGQFHRSPTPYLGPFVHDFIFNPNPEINLAAVSYQDGVTIVFDPDRQSVQATADTDAVVLSASPDGTTLAVGTGDGIIKLYEFETLKLLKQIFLQQEAIRAISFNSSGTRFFDIRGDYCNVWEPSVLVRRSTSDDSSIDISERVPQSAEFSHGFTWAEGLAILAMAPHHGGNFVFCGRENGAITAYRTKTGQPAQELYSHTRGVDIDHLLWNQTTNILVSVDISGRILARRIVQRNGGPFEISEPILNESVNLSPRQVLMNHSGTRLMASGAEKHTVWDLKSGLLIRELPQADTRQSCRWDTHPQTGNLLLFVAGEVHAYSWESFELLSVTAYELSEGSAKDDFHIENAICLTQCRNLSLISSTGKFASLAHTMHILPSEISTQGTQDHQLISSYERPLKDFKVLIGTYRTWLVFLQHSGWVCSVNLETCTTDKSYTRHFFVPFQWHSTVASPAVAITSQRSIILAVKHEIAVFHSGLDYEEKVPF